MTLRLSTGAQNFLNKRGSMDDMLRNGRIEIYSGAQPVSADAALTGTLLATITANAAPITNEILAAGSVTLAGAAGSLNTLTVNGVDILGGAVPFDSTLGQTALDVAAAINAHKSSPDYTATAVGAVVTISALPGTGTTPNGFAVAAGATTMTATPTNMAGGVSPANGLLFGNSLAGVLTKLASQVWSGVNAATGTAGWFRMYGSVADTGALDAQGVVLRLDGAVASAGGEMNFNSTAFTAGATTTLAGWGLTQPAS
jgi:hypothetical protein